MKSENNPLKIHIYGKINELCLNKLFPEPCSLKRNEKFIGDRQIKTQSYTWIAKLYKQKNLEDNFNLIADEIQKDSDENFNNHIVLSFEDEKIEELFQKIDDIGYVYLPRFIFITKAEQTYNFERENIFITNIIQEGEMEEDLIKKIEKELWEIDCYYNERVLDNGKPSYNLLEEEDYSPKISINILLTGISGSGKSTFINIINNSLIALENDDKESVTKRISEYNIYLDNKNTKNGFIKFIDTPGFNCQLNSKKNIDLNQINKNILNLIKEYKNKNSFDNIHFVLFFLNQGSRLSGIEEILKSFANENYYILFIINRLPNDNKIKSKEIKSISKFLKNLSLEVDEKNIIACNIIHTGDNNKGYGINKIFNRIYDILKEKNNIFFNNSFLNDMEKCNNNMIEILNNQHKNTNEFEKYLGESIILKKELAEMNQLFEKYIGEENRIETGKKNAENQINKYRAFGILSATLPIPYTDFLLIPTLQAKLIINIINGFNISILELDKDDFIDFLKVGGGREVAHLGINKMSKKCFENTAKGCLVKSVKDFFQFLIKYLAKEQGNKTISESSKGIPLIGYFVGGTIGSILNYKSIDYLGKRTIEFCEQYSRKIGSLDSIIKRIKIFSQIFKDIEKLSLKENWWNYKAKIIKNHQ